MQASEVFKKGAVLIIIPSSVRCSLSRVCRSWIRARQASAGGFLIKLFIKKTARSLNQLSRVSFSLPMQLRMTLKITEPFSKCSNDFFYSQVNLFKWELHYSATLRDVSTDLSILCLFYSPTLSTEVSSRTRSEPSSRSRDCSEKAVLHNFLKKKTLSYSFYSFVTMSFKNSYETASYPRRGISRDSPYPKQRYSSSFPLLFVQIVLSTLHTWFIEDSSNSLYCTLYKSYYSFPQRRSFPSQKSNIDSESRHNMSRALKHSLGSLLQGRTASAIRSLSIPQSWRRQSIAADQLWQTLRISRLRAREGGERAS